MSNLSPEEKELILNFYFGCGEEQDLNRARNLVADNPQAAKLYASLQDTLSQLDSIKYEPCPDNLAQVTVARLKLSASAGDCCTCLSGRGDTKRRSDRSPWPVLDCLC